MSADADTAPAVLEPVLEPVPVDGCRICIAARNGRESSRGWGTPTGISHFNDIIAAHPHRGQGEVTT
jgi:hypothetical protein